MDVGRGNDLEAMGASVEGGLIEAVRALRASVQRTCETGKETHEIEVAAVLALHAAQG